MLALTATATSEVTEDIRRELGIPATGVVESGSFRPNLDLRVEQVPREADKLERVLAIAKQVAGSGIVYTSTVKAAVAVHDALAGADESVALYHGRLSAGDRAAAQEAFMAGDRRLMVATNAFGLGIDKPDIRFVLHYQLPPNLEAYYQEAGRAGRDGEAATCTLLFLRRDKAVQQFFLGGRYPSDDDALALYAALHDPPPEGEAWTAAALQSRVARPRSKVQVALSLLRRQAVIGTDGDAITLLKPGLEHNDVLALMREYRDRRVQDRDGLEQMVFYAQAGGCRWHLLLEHLDGEAPFERCGTCDNCRRIAAHEKVLDSLAAQTAHDEAPHQAHRTPFTRGDIVVVKRYGRGIVDDASAVQVTVAFSDGVRRNFQPEYVAPFKRGAQTARAIASRKPGMEKRAA